MILEQTKCISIAYLYHRDDLPIFEALYRHLVVLRRDSLIKEWYENLAGATFQEQTKLRLEQSQVIILLLSSSFENDDRYSGPEMIAHISKCSEKGVCIWPIIAKPFHWEKSIFRKYNIFFGEGKDKPITSYNSQDEAHKRIVERIDCEIAQMLAEEWARDGDTYHHHMHLQDALLAYEHSLHYMSDYIPALLGKGRIFSKLNKSEEAKQLFQRVISSCTPIQQEGKDVAFSLNQQVNLVQACCKGHALLELKRFQEALMAFQQVYQQCISPMNNTKKSVCAEAHCGEGDAYLMLGDQYTNSINYYNQALVSYQKAREFVSDQPIYLTKIGEVYIKLGNRLQINYLYEKALDIYNQVVHLFPNYTPAHVKMGNALYLLLRHKEALIAYETALQCDPQEFHAHGERGYILLASNNSKEALSAFEKALSIDKHNSRYLYGKGRAQARLGFHDEALSTYNEAFDCGFVSTSLFIHRAMTLVELGDAEYTYSQQTQGDLYYKDAFAVYKHALQQKYSKNNEIYYGLGRIYFAYRDWKNALGHYQKAIDLAPHDANIYLEMGKTFIRLGDNVNAFACLKRAQECCDQPDSMVDEVDIQIAYGDIYCYLAGDIDSEEYYNYQEKALNFYKEATLTRKDAKAYIGLGKTCATLHYYEEAIDALNQALELNPRLIECYVIKGRCCYELGQYSEAHFLYQTAIDSGLDKAAIRNAQGDALLAMKRYIDAIRVFNYVIEHMEDEIAHAYRGRGIALYSLERIEAALDSFEEAISLDPLICSQSQYRRRLEDIGFFIEVKLRNDPQDASTYKDKGNVLLLLGENIKDAINLYTRAIEYGDRSADVYYHRGKAYYMMHEYRKALKDYRKALDINSSHYYAQQGQQIAENMMEQHQQNFVKKIVPWLKIHKEP